MAILNCPNCKSHQQDILHGMKMRVMNERRKDGAYKGHRCTVCGNTREVPQDRK